MYNSTMIRSLILVLCLCLFAGCAKPPTTAPDEVEATASGQVMKMPKDPKDAELFTQLKEAGHDFSKETEVDFYLYFPEEGAARGALQVLSADGYNGTIENREGQWLCHLKKKMVLTADVIDMERFKFRDLTVNTGGEYDGWGAPVVK